MTEEQLSFSSAPLDGNNNLFLDLWLCFYERIVVNNKMMTLNYRYTGKKNSKPSGGAIPYSASVGVGERRCTEWTHYTD